MVSFSPRHVLILPVAGPNGGQKKTLPRPLKMIYGTMWTITLPMFLSASTW